MAYIPFGYMSPNGDFCALGRLILFPSGWDNSETLQKRVKNRK